MMTRRPSWEEQRLLLHCAQHSGAYLSLAANWKHAQDKGAGIENKESRQSEKLLHGERAGSDCFVCFRFLVAIDDGFGLDFFTCLLIFLVGDLFRQRSILIGKGLLQ